MIDQHCPLKTALTLSMVHMMANQYWPEGCSLWFRSRPKLLEQYESTLTCCQVLQDSPVGVRCTLMWRPTCILRRLSTPNSWPEGPSEILHLCLACRIHLDL